MLPNEIDDLWMELPIKVSRQKFHAICNKIRNATLDEVAQDVKFLMSFVDYLNVDDVPEGLDPTFYHTLTQSGDEKLAEQVKAIKQKYHIVRQMKEGDDDAE